MANELMPCPVCGGTVHNDSITLACGNRYPSGYSDGEIGCPYFLDVNCDKLKTPDARMYWLAHTHNTLARRAEIGRLVEDVLSKTGYFQVEEESDEHGRMYDVRTQERSSYTETLLDALRELAAEQATTVCKACGGSGDNRGGDCPKCDGTGIGGSDDD